MVQQRLTVTIPAETDGADVDVLEEDQSNAPVPEFDKMGHRAVSASMIGGDDVIGFHLINEAVDEHVRDIAVPKGDERFPPRGAAEWPEQQTGRSGGPGGCDLLRLKLRVAIGMSDDELIAVSTRFFLGTSQGPKMHNAVHAGQDKEEVPGLGCAMLRPAQVRHERADAAAPDKNSLVNEALDGSSHGQPRDAKLGGEVGFGRQDTAPLKTTTSHQQKQPELHLMVERDWTGSVDPHHRQPSVTAASGST